jgi:hypothetical protein
MLWVDLARGGLVRVQTRVLVVIIRIRIRCIVGLHVLHWAISGVTTKSALIIDAPGQDLMIVC